MTKEQAINHKEIIKWWLDNTDKGVWELTPIGWELTFEPNFYPADIYVQNDEYVEYRKALADGKTIEFKERNDNIWYEVKSNITPTRNFNSIYEYCIKPEEPKFKIGDWIINTTNGLKEQVTETNINIINKNYNFDKWKPQDGEWCVFWDDDVEEFLIGRYGSIHEQDSHGLGELQFYYTKDYWDNVAPLEFIETVKDK